RGAAADLQDAHGTVRRKAKEIEAVRGIDFEVREGELFGLLGPNGAGKTTKTKMRTTGVGGPRSRRHDGGWPARRSATSPTCLAPSCSSARSTGSRDSRCCAGSMS